MTEQTASLPTGTDEQTAEAGCVLVRGPDNGSYPLSDALAWREDATYVILSTEFDVLAEGDTFDEALDLLICRLLDYGSLLHEQFMAEQQTPDEAVAYATLTGRLFPLVAAMQQNRPRLRRRWPRRYRGSGKGHWRHRGTPASSSAGLSAA